MPIVTIGYVAAGVFGTGLLFGVAFIAGIWLALKGLERALKLSTHSPPRR